MENFNFQPIYWQKKILPFSQEKSFRSYELIPTQGIFQCGGISKSAMQQE